MMVTTAHFAFSPIPRPRLERLLDSAVTGAHRRVVLVCAPPGSGKTVFAAEWLRRFRADRPETDWQWIDGDSGDDEVRELLIRGAERARPARPAPPPRRVLVIDDAHLVSDPRTLAAIDHLLHRDPGVTLVLLARREPPLAWHSLVLERRMIRIGPEELAFGREQVAALLGEHGCAPERTEIDAVIRLTRGWPALVRIAAAERARHPDLRATLDALVTPGSEAGVYLDRELVAPQPPAVRKFLVRTSVPDRFTGALAARLAGEAAPRILDRLLRDAFPVSAVRRDGGLWFGYPPLVRAHLRAADVAGADDAHRAAAEWYVSAGLPAAALPHVLARPGQPGLPGFLGDPALRMIHQGAGRALFDAVESAERVRADDPFVWALRGLDAIERGDIAHAVTFVDLACRAAAGDTAVPRRRLVPVLLTATLATALAAGDGLDSIRLPDVLPLAGTPVVDGYTAVTAGAARAVAGDPGGGLDDLRRGYALARAAGDPRLVLRAESWLAVALGWRGAPAAAADRAADAATTAAASGLGHTADAARAATAAAYARFLTAATPPPTAGGPGGRSEALDEVLDGLLRAEEAADLHRLAETIRTTLAGSLREAALPERVSAELLLPHVARFLLGCGTPRTAGLLVGEARRCLGDSTGVVLARAVLAEGAHRPAVTRALLDPLERDIAALAPQFAALVWLLEARSRTALGVPTQALAALRRAVDVAAPAGIVRPFLETPGILALLDDHAGTFGAHNAFVAAVRTHPRARRATAPLLTETERSVLAQLPSGRTTRQIAETLGVSMNTVKTHLRRIYTKFGTSSRAGTMQYARRAGLL